MQETLYQTADAGVSIYETGGARDYIRQRMKETISDSGYRSLYFRQRMQKTLYQIADEGVSI